MHCVENASRLMLVNVNYFRKKKLQLSGLKIKIYRFRNAAIYNNSIENF